MLRCSTSLDTNATAKASTVYLHIKRGAQKRLRSTTDDAHDDDDDDDERTRAATQVHPSVMQLQWNSDELAKLQLFHASGTTSLRFRRIDPHGLASCSPSHNNNNKNNNTKDVVGPTSSSSAPQHLHIRQLYAHQHNELIIECAYNNYHKDEDDVVEDAVQSQDDDDDDAWYALEHIPKSVDLEDAMNALDINDGVGDDGDYEMPPVHTTTSLHASKRVRDQDEVPRVYLHPKRRLDDGRAEHTQTRTHNDGDGDDVFYGYGWHYASSADPHVLQQLKQWEEFVVPQDDDDALQDLYMYPDHRHDDEYDSNAEDFDGNDYPDSIDDGDDDPEHDGGCDNYEYGYGDDDADYD